MKLTAQSGARRNARITWSKERLLLILSLLALLVAYLATCSTSEPFYNNDETRHLMTGVYFKDVLHDLPLAHLRAYTINYYLQYPALGLLIWPPFFYLIEGLFMSVFGTSIVVGKALILLFTAVACSYLFLLVRRSHDALRATIALLMFGLSPLVFELSRYIMLEVPTMALSLAAIYHFTRYLDLERRRDLITAALASAFAALTRFDAVYLLPFFVILLSVRRQVNILWRREALMTIAASLLIVAPWYVLSASSVGWLHFKFATETLSPELPAFLSLKRLLFYPILLSRQLGVLASLAAAIGLIFGLAAPYRERSLTYIVLIIATYITFTPIGDMESRHTIYWLPAFAAFAADGIAIMTNRLRAYRLYLPLAGLVLVATGWTALAKPPRFVRGYEEAAQYVSANTRSSPYCLFLGGLDGDFIYQLRRHDLSRKLWILRADKLLFSVLIVPGGDYKRFAKSEQDVLDMIFKYDPEFLIVEKPSLIEQDTPNDVRNRFEEQVRSVVTNHPDRFRLEKEFAVETNDTQFIGRRLALFRNTLRNPEPERHLELNILMLRRSLDTVVP